MKRVKARRPHDDGGFDVVKADRAVVRRCGGVGGRRLLDIIPRLEAPVMKHPVSGKRDHRLTSRLLSAPFTNAFVDDFVVIPRQLCQINSLFIHLSGLPQNAGL